MARRPDIAARVRRSGAGLVVYYSERSYTEHKKQREPGDLISDFHFSLISLDFQLISTDFLP